MAASNECQDWLWAFYQDMVGGGGCSCVCPCAALVSSLHNNTRSRAARRRLNPSLSPLSRPLSSQRGRPRDVLFNYFRGQGRKEDLTVRACCVLSLCCAFALPPAHTEHKTQHTPPQQTQKKPEIMNAVQRAVRLAFPDQGGGGDVFTRHRDGGAAGVMDNALCATFLYYR